MKYSPFAISAVLAATKFPFVVQSTKLRNHIVKGNELAVDPMKDSEKNVRKLSSDMTTCLGKYLSPGQKLEAGESICGKVDGEMVYFGVRSYPNKPEPGYTLYRLEIWSKNGTHDRWFRGIGTKSGEAPYLRFQKDGHLVFDGDSATGDCRAKPNARGSSMKARIEGPLPDLLKVYDSRGAVAWTISQKTLSNNDVYIAGSGCYPEVGPKCVSVLKAGERLTWNEYVCEFNASGDAVSRFGLDIYGLLVLERNENELAWRPGPDHIRGDYLRLQKDGHLTLFRNTEPSKTYTWQSTCFGKNNKITVSDDVHQFNPDGSVTWSLAGEVSPEPNCLPGCD